MFPAPLLYCLESSSPKILTHTRGVCSELPVNLVDLRQVNEMKKTTIEIPDPLFLKAKIRAARDGLSMRDLFLRAPFFLIFAILITACAAPTAVPPTATLTPMTPTATLEPSPTATQPAPREGVGTATPEAVNVATMSEFDRAWFNEAGKVVEVADLYGAGEAKITVAQVKEPTEGQVLNYEEMFSLDQESFANGPVTLNRISLKGLTIERISQLNVDIADNMRVGDGKWCVFQFGTLVGGKQVSFEMVVKGNFFNGKLGQDIFTQWEPGEVVSGGLTFSYYPSGGVTMDDLDNYILNEKGLSGAELKLLST